MITVVGIADGKKDNLTIKAYDHIINSDCVYLQSFHIPIYKEIDKNFETLDMFFENAVDFDQLKTDVAKSLVDLALKQDLTFCALGDVFQNEIAYTLIHYAEKFYIKVNIIGGVACNTDAIALALTSGENKPDGIKQISGYSFDIKEALYQAMIIYEIDSPFMASEIKLKLLRFFNQDQAIYIATGEGVKKIELEDLDRMDKKIYGYDFCAYIPPCSTYNQSGYGFLDLTDIMRKLRSKGGCPWDHKQTHQSLTKYLVEEAYEVLDAVEINDMNMLYDELGDVLLQVVFHSEIGFEHSEFDSIDVTSAICKKMIHRHPHVFSSVKVKDADQVVDNWEVIKGKEKGLTSYADDLKDVPKHMPSLMRSHKVQKRAAKCGFDWEDYRIPMDKVYEELLELKEDIEANKDCSLEMGDLLFAVVNLARHLGVDSEVALYKGIEKFIERFEKMEMMVNQKHQTLDNLTLKEMDEYWNKCKC